MMNLTEEIKNRLNTQFSPSQLEVIDQSDQHIGHVGQQSGGKHYLLKISAECFSSQSLIKIHRDIYRVLDDLMTRQIHALQIKVYQSNDAANCS